jgi:hypothetical protein
VDSANTSRLRQLPSTQIEYQSQDFPGFDSKDQRISLEQMDRLLDRLVAPKSIGLKVSRCRYLFCVLSDLFNWVDWCAGYVNQSECPCGAPPYGESLMRRFVRT